jgi:hypothetical protein
MLGGLTRDAFSVVLSFLVTPRDVAIARSVCRAWRDATAARWEFVKDMCIMHTQLRVKNERHVVTVFNTDRWELRGALRFVFMHRDRLAQALLKAFFGQELEHRPCTLKKDVYDLYTVGDVYFDTLTICNATEDRGKLGFYKTRCGADGSYSVNIVDFLAPHARRFSESSSSTGEKSSTVTKKLKC